MLLRAIAAGLAILCAFLFFMWGVIGDAWGHEWYEARCCSGKDCAPISDDEVTERDGGFYIKSRNEFIEFNDTRQGKDDQFHICVNELTNVRLCFYRKFNGS